MPSGSKAAAPLLGLVSLLALTAVIGADADSQMPIPPPSGVVMVDPASAGKSVESAAGATVAATPSAFGTNVRVNVNAASLSRPQVEPSVTSNPADRNQQVAGFADYVFDVFPGVSRTTDGGKTWSAPTGGPTLPNPPGFRWGSRSSVGFLAGGDPAVAWGIGNDVYYSTLGFQDFAAPPTPGVCDVGGLYVYRSSDAGNTWSLPAAGPAVANTQRIHRDKEYIVVDTNAASLHVGTVYLVWDDDEYSACPHSFPGNFAARRIMFSKSTDSGVTWSAPLTLATGCLVTPIPAIGADGSVYVVWYDCSSGIRQLVRKSSNGGASFAPAVAAASGLTPCPNPLTGARFRVNGLFPTIAADPTDANLIYVAWSSCTSGALSDVFFSRSADGGATWSAAPLRVNDDGSSNRRDQFFPWMAVDDRGVIRLMWGDDRLDLANEGGHFYDIFAAESTDQGLSFGQNVRVTTQSSDPDVDFGGTFIGDYFGMAPCGTPVWTDTRDGNEDIYGAPLDSDANGLTDSCARDTTAPSVIIDQAAGQADPTSTSPINFAVAFDEPVSGFETGDVTLGGTAGATTAVVTGGPSTYEVAVSGMTRSGTVLASIAAGVAVDAADNANTASTSTDNTITFQFVPACDGRQATIYVSESGRIVGGPFQGQLYKSELRGSDNADVIVGTDAADKIVGRAGDDVMCGAGGADKLTGEQGADTLVGGNGRDTLEGGDGRDRLTGNGGNDTAADKFDGGLGTDTAVDFNSGEGDSGKNVEVF